MAGEDIYLRAFWDLRTEAVSGDVTIGHIPWSKAREYAREHLGLDPDMLEPFWIVISTLDAALHRWMKSEHERHSRVNKSSAPKIGNRSRARRTRE